MSGLRYSKFFLKWFGFKLNFKCKVIYICENKNTSYLLHYLCILYDEKPSVSLKNWFIHSIEATDLKANIVCGCLFEGEPRCLSYPRYSCCCNWKYRNRNWKWCGNPLMSGNRKIPIRQTTYHSQASVQAWAFEAQFLTLQRARKY